MNAKTSKLLMEQRSHSKRGCFRSPPPIPQSILTGQTIHPSTPKHPPVQKLDLRCRPLDHILQHRVQIPAGCCHHLLYSLQQLCFSPHQPPTAAAAAAAAAAVTTTTATQRRSAFCHDSRHHLPRGYVVKQAPVAAVQQGGEGVDARVDCELGQQLLDQVHRGGGGDLGERGRTVAGGWMSAVDS